MINKSGIIAISAILIISISLVLINSKEISITRLPNFDADQDSVVDNFDNCPKIKNSDQTDFDKDTLGNPCDLDDDNDGVVDKLDAFDTDPTEWADFDFDGTGSILDKDDDNDGILDDKDSTPSPISEKLIQQYMTEIESCVLADDANSFLCYGNFFDSLVKNESNNENALKLALALSKINAIGGCHFISHVVGHAVFDETLNVSQNFDFDASLCRGGYYHGIMGAFFHNLKENNKPISDNYKVICDDLMGTSNYSDCIHGLGHGLINYNPANLESAIEYCHQMSYFQYYSCTAGVMMQYTDNQLTEFGATKENLSDMCSESKLNKFTFNMCSKNIGISLAFHNNHDLNKSSKFCQMIENEKGSEICLEQLKKEILKDELGTQTQFTENEKTKFQPQWIKQGDGKWIVDFNSKAVISDFEYVEGIKMMQFSFDVPEMIKIYAWNELLPEKLIVTINGEHERNVVIKRDTVEPITSIMISPDVSGTVLIVPLPE
ncbi:thrombospondin type 3 repeat-containing protein [Nitrosopumilus ureiphilus]|uniref:Thrombospondin n=1 Tax=Nitrosopumilus ureiphilus TaxID=1470067 RepID=A0A7D5M7R4_9ARCH|nr:thrombospondin type 3 repeat-containing protein [Nitrosopumilus ureiphilus]QLH06550.1 thrombospondin [Nitrosopumilus ureiphilus]